MAVVVSKQQQRNVGGVFDRLSSSSPRWKYIVVTISGLAMVLILLIARQNANDPVLSVPLATTSFHKARALEPNKIVHGLYKHEAYYHCPAATTQTSNNKQTQHIVLWHGASYTKEDWKTSGILQKLCNIDHYSVTALDLSHKSTHEPLVKLLKGLSEEQGLIELPLAALVTPSASGLGVVDWINKDPAQVVRSVKLWIPIASPAVTKLQASRMKEMKERQPPFPVLAIYGDKDIPKGKERSELLRDKMGAEVVELQGKHSCYWDSPDAFIETLTTRLSSSSTLW